MGGSFRKILLMVIVIAIVFVAFIITTKIIKKIKKALSQGNLSSKGATFINGEVQTKPCIFIEYVSEGGFLEDGKCGWLDIECEDGEEKTVTLKFNKKAPQPITVPLKVAKYRITYRAKSKASLAASGILRTINESSGAMGAFANAVYDAGEINGQLSSVVVDVNEDFLLKLRCSTDGLQKSCQVVS